MLNNTCNTGVHTCGAVAVAHVCPQQQANGVQVAVHGGDVQRCGAGPKARPACVGGGRSFPQFCFVGQQHAHGGSGLDPRGVVQRRGADGVDAVHQPARVRWVGEMGGWGGGGVAQGGWWWWCLWGRAGEGHDVPGGCQLRTGGTRCASGLTPSTSPALTVPVSPPRHLQDWKPDMLQAPAPPPVPHCHHTLPTRLPTTMTHGTSLRHAPPTQGRIAPPPPRQHPRSPCGAHAFTMCLHPTPRCRTGRRPSPPLLHPPW